MNVDPRIDVIGAAVGDRSRALIIAALMDGRAYTAKELAYRARISAQTASFHLKRLVDWGLLRRYQKGRHRFYFLANEDIASMIEAMMLVAPAEHLRRQPKRASDQMALARCCYNHLAGRLSVEVAARFAEVGALLSRGGDFSLTPSGISYLAEIGLDANGIELRGRPVVRNCLDWTERRFHFAGVLGTVLLEHFLTDAWLERIDQSRALRVTPKGLALFQSKLQLPAGVIDPRSEGGRASS
jgi:DNA-binding transcriptional ArsR family regulator